MDTVLLLKALILGMVEGFTEFLPVSSTGHLILAGDLLGFNDDRGKFFEIVIQSGAILAVCWEYRRRLGHVLVSLTREPESQRFVVNLAVAFLPLAMLGLAFGKAIKAHLFQPVPVALAFIVGAFVIIWAERRPHKIRIETNRLCEVPYGIVVSGLPCKNNTEIVLNSKIARHNLQCLLETVNGLLDFPLPYKQIGQIRMTAIHIRFQDNSIFRCCDGLI